MIFQAGVDYETRPMYVSSPVSLLRNSIPCCNDSLVINASALPDPQQFLYDILLARILAYLNLYVESDYTLVFFAAGGRYTPGWNWVWKAYRSLSRKYRKNLKQLYIVHSSFFTKMLFSLAGAMISPKFFRKIVYVQTLSELARHVPITQIDIPPAVYQENLKHEDQITLPAPSRSNTFGIPLEELMGYHGEKGGVPRVVRESIQFLRETGLREEGLFRRSPQSTMLRAAQEAYDRGNLVSLHTFGDPHIAAVLLKKFLRDLPEPIFSERLYPVIQRCPAPSPDPSNTASIYYIRETLLPELAPCAYILLSQVFHLMHEVSLQSSINRMDAYNLAVVLCPNLVKGQNLTKDVMLCAVSTGSPASPFASLHGQGPAPDRLTETGGMTLGMIVKLCIERYYDVFDEAQDVGEAATLTTTPGAVGPNGATMKTRDREEGVDIGTVVTSTSLDGCSTDVGTHPSRGEDIGQDEEDDEEEIDDAMLAMSIGPSHGRNGSLGVGEFGVWNGMNASASMGVGYKVRQRPNMNRSRTADGNVKGFAYATLSKAKSVIGIEKGQGGGEVNGEKRRGSISIGGGGKNSKGVGSGVEALGVTAAGFFAPPGGRV
ncbi:hypothetical protein AX15_004708 [Amanita polypyramis BW_CC]|nr:hypothetical protein AX15_004708 [Amanita polypyramis BW_CC]